MGIDHFEELEQLCQSKKLSQEPYSKHLKRYDDYYYGLRLDYKGNPYFNSGNMRNSCGVIRFKANGNVNEFEVPVGGTFDEWDYPFTATGFTSGNNGRLGVPEWRTSTPVEFRDGTEI